MSVIDEIKDRLDIVEVIGTYVQLKKAGRSYKGLCPFHNEKTPSFVVFPDSQNWRCFGACGTGGDMFSFVMKRENVDFGDALALLATRAGVEVKPQTEAAGAEEGRLERLRAIQSDTALYFNYLLNKADEAALARAYLERRGLTRETWETWQLGYSLDSWDALKNRLQGKGYTPQELEEAGVVIRNEEKGSYYDRFRGRLMIPIRDGQGRTIGFGARILREDPSHPGPKYMNSPQTPLFDKGNVLFGLDMAKKAIRDANLAVIVEGYMDVLMSHQVGVTNVVAGMGTALTEAQMRLIKRYTSNVTLALDPDVAGEHAAARGLEAARQSLDKALVPVPGRGGLVRLEARLKAQIRVASLPDGLDPDELAYRDVDRWREVIRAAKPVVDYYLDQICKEEDVRDAQGQARIVDRMAPVIAELSNHVERQRYMQLLARRIKTDERLIQEVVSKHGQAEVERTVEGEGSRIATLRLKWQQERYKPAIAALTSLYGPEEHLLTSLISRPDLIAKLDEEMISLQSPPLSNDDFAKAENKAILTVLIEATDSVSLYSPVAERLTGLPATVADRANTLLKEFNQLPSLTDEQILEDLVDSLLRLRERNLKVNISEAKALIQSLDPVNDAMDIRRLGEFVATYQVQRNHLSQTIISRTNAGIVARRKYDEEG